MGKEKKCACFSEEEMKQMDSKVGGLIDEYNAWRKKIEKDVRNPDFSTSVYTFLTWAEILKYDDDLELARLALKRAETCHSDDLFSIVTTGDYVLDLLDDKTWAIELYRRAENELEDPSYLCRLAGSVVKGLEDKCWAAEILKKALLLPCGVDTLILAANLYAKDLDMYEIAEEMIDETVLPLSGGDFHARMGIAEFYSSVKFDSMNAGEFYRDALGLVKTLKQRCQLAISVRDNESEEWSNEIYRHSVESFLVEPDFEGLLDIMDELEVIDPDLADEHHGTLIELAGEDPKKIEKLLHLEWWED